MVTTSIHSALHSLGGIQVLMYMYHQLFTLLIVIIVLDYHEKFELLFLFLKALFPLFSQLDTAQLTPVKGKTVIDYTLKLVEFVNCNVTLLHSLSPPLPPVLNYYH